MILTIGPPVITIIAIISNKVQVVCSNIEKVSPVEIFSEKFMNIKNTLLEDGTKLIFNVKELTEKLEYLKWYAKDNKNFKTTLTSVNNSITLQVKENICVLNSNSQVEDFTFNFNLESVLGALKGRYKNEETVSIYVNNSNLYCIELSKDEHFYSSKIVE